MHLVGFITRIYHNARSLELQILNTFSEGDSSFQDSNKMVSGVNKLVVLGEIL